MAVEKKRKLGPAYQRRGLSGDSGEFWSYLGVDVESMSPNSERPGRAHARAGCGGDLSYRKRGRWDAQEARRGRAPGGPRARRGTILLALGPRERRGERENRSAASRPHALMHSIDEKGVREMSNS